MKFSRVCTSCLLGYKGPLSLANGCSCLTPLAVLPNTGIHCLLGNINYNHKQNAKKEVINLFRTDLYFQLLQYNTYLVTISFIHNINYWWLDQGRRYLGWRLLIRNNIFTDIGLGCFWKSSSNNGLQPSFLGN